MKIIGFCLICGSILGLFSPIPASAETLPINQTHIQGGKKYWSWVASTQAVLRYFDVHRSQEEIGDYGTNGYDVPNLLHGNGDFHRHGVDEILFDFGAIESVGFDSVMPPERVYMRIKYFGTPIIIRWAKDYGDSSEIGLDDRIVVIKGARYYDQKLYLMLMDPIDGTYEKEYDWVVRGAGHIWAETLDIITRPTLNNASSSDATKSSSSKILQTLTGIGPKSVDWDGERLLMQETL